MESPEPSDDVRECLIEERVSAAMACTFRLEMANAGGRLPKAEREEKLRMLFRQIALAIGVDRFREAPVELLDQFAVMSIVKNKDPGALLVSLLNAFMIAYSTPETSDAAFASLAAMEGVRETVALARGTVPVLH